MNRNWKHRIYSKFHRICAEPLIWNRVFSQPRNLAQTPASEGTWWFHAASVGELETLWSVIRLGAEKGVPLIITVFSESATQAIQILPSELKTIPKANLIHCGFSPWEGRWHSALQHYQPSQFITAKYEAWPDLWASLASLDIPLTIVGAKARRSIKIAKTTTHILTGGMLPRIRFLVDREVDAANLRPVFPQSEIHVVGDPRWDRVRSRADVGNPRAKALTQTWAQCRRPWAVFGSIWEEDLNRWGNLIAEAAREGTIWLVPHKIDQENLQKLEKNLSQIGIQAVRTRHIQAKSELAPDEVLLVDEMGFLLELYREADWAYVGGGFGEGVHSTIEPAIQGIPVISGNHRAEYFSEIQFLKSICQLRVVSNSSDIQKWWDQGHRKNHSPDQIQEWRTHHQTQWGASQRVFELLK